MWTQPFFFEFTSIAPEQCLRCHFVLFLKGETKTTDCFVFSDIISSTLLVAYWCSPLKDLYGFMAFFLS